MNPRSIRTHVVSRCCVNAPKNHPHKWPYFRRVGRGEYIILDPYDIEKQSLSRVEESPSTYAAADSLQNSIHVVVRRSAGFFVAESLELALVTQARSLDELLRNLRQAVRLHLEGEDPAAFGLTVSPRIVLTYEENLPGDGET